MLGIILFVAGGLLVAFVFYDFLRTTISLAGLGPISSRITYSLWRLARRVVPRAERRPSAGLRNLVGPAIQTVIAIAWILLHLVGYTAMFAAGTSLAKADTGEPASLLDTVAFVGASLSTLGASIVEPTNGWWDVLSMVAAVNGMVVLTLSVSFILTILQITTSARTFALRFHALTAHLEPDDTHGCLERVASLGPDLCELVTRITASPLPGVFVPREATLSFPASVLQLCALLEQAGDELPQSSSSRGEIAELKWGLMVLGQHAPHQPDASFGAACRWARTHALEELA